MKHFIRLTGGALQAFEFVVFVCAATALVAIGPAIWTYRLFAAGHAATAAAVATLWLASVAMVAYEIRREAISIVSLGVFLAWLVVLVWAFE